MSNGGLWLDPDSGGQPIASRRLTISTARQLTALVFNPFYMVGLRVYTMLLSRGGFWSCCVGGAMHLFSRLSRTVGGYCLRELI